MLEFDHLVLLSRDVNSDADLVAEQGFTIEPLGRHPLLGTCNRLIMLETTYVELLGVERSTVHTTFKEACLSNGAEIVGIALRGDVRRAYEDLRSRGYTASPPLAFSRPIKTSSGIKEARFEIVKLDVAHTPGAWVFVCEHKTPELVWRQPAAAHLNRAKDIANLTWIASDARRMATAYAEVLGMEVAGTTDAPTLTFPNATFHFRAASSQRATSALPPGEDGRFGGVEFRGTGGGEIRTWPNSRIHWTMRS